MVAQPADHSTVVTGAWAVQCAALEAAVVLAAAVATVVAVVAHQVVVVATQVVVAEAADKQHRSY